jgi:hypothetical protein
VCDTQVGGALGKLYFNTKSASAATTP